MDGMLHAVAVVALLECSDPEFEGNVFEPILRT
jgi:hypothetical protein